MPSYIMALDAGTTSNRCILFDRAGHVCSMAQKEFTQFFPKPGWVEHDAEEIWSVQLEVAQQAMRNIGASASDIAAIGITNQRETTVVWNKKTGRPVCPAIVWQCRRTAGYCDSLKERGLVEPIRRKTGLVLDAYFSATKLRWILEQTPGARTQAARGELCFGTVETWLIWKLTGGRLHVTDASNASRTMLFNIHTLQWDREILEELGIPLCMLPEVRSSSEVYGMTEPGWFGAPIPIAGAAGDQQAALFGQACFQPGEAKCTYGTGCFLLMNTGDRPVDSQNGLVTTIAWGLGGKVQYALEGSVFTAGRIGVSGPPGAGYQRLLRGPRLYRSGRASLGFLRPGDHRGPHPGSEPQSHHPGHPGRSGVPDGGCAPGYAGRFRHRFGRPEGGRRCIGQQLPDAGPGGSHRRAGAPAPVRGNHGHGRILPGRIGGGDLE